MATIRAADSVKLYHTYSDAGIIIQQNETDMEYTEAIDVEDAAYTYTETETKIETPEMTDEEYLNMSVLKVIDKAVSHSTSV